MAEVIDIGINASVGVRILNAIAALDAKVDDALNAFDVQLSELGEGIAEVRGYLAQLDRDLNADVGLVYDDDGEVIGELRLAADSDA